MEKGNQNHLLQKKKKKGPAPPKPKGPKPPEKKSQALANIEDPLGKIHAFCSRGAKSDVYEFIGMDSSLVNTPGKVGNSCLHWAAQAGHEDIVELLIHEGANVEAKNDNGDTPLHLAAWKDYDKCARLLVGAGAVKNTKNNDGKTQFDMVHSEAMRKVVPEFDSEEAKETIVQADDDDDDGSDIDW